MAEWSKDWKLSLSPGKCETSFFSTYTKEAKWQPKIQIDETILPFNPTPKFLGLTYDRQLTFKDHCQNIKSKIQNKTRAIRKVANTDWGFEKSTLRQTYTALVRPVCSSSLATVDHQLQPGRTWERTKIRSSSSHWSSQDSTSGINYQRSWIAER